MFSHSSFCFFCSITNEAGASIYSVSPEAVKEMPDLDPNLRSAGDLAKQCCSSMVTKNIIKQLCDVVDHALIGTVKKARSSIIIIKYLLNCKMLKSKCSAALETCSISTLSVRFQHCFDMSPTWFASDPSPICYLSLRPHTAWVKRNHTRMFQADFLYKSYKSNKAGLFFSSFLCSSTESYGEPYLYP